MNGQAAGTTPPSSPRALPDRFDADWRERIGRIGVVALDLDDTLLNADRRVTRNTRQALDDWQATGRRIVVATGRPPRYARAIPEYLHGLPLVCYNGCWIEHRDQVLRKSVISAAATQRLMQEFLDEAPGIWVGVESEDMMYESFKFRPWRYSAVCDMRQLERPAAKILFRKSHMSERQFQLLNDLLPDEAEILISDMYDLIQIMKKGADKFEGIRWWLHSCRMTSEQLAAVGDDTNDVTMVQHAALGVAMGNAVPEVKAVADFVTLTNDEEGVAKTLNAILATAA